MGIQLKKSSHFTNKMQIDLTLEKACERYWIFISRPSKFKGLRTRLACNNGFIFEEQARNWFRLCNDKLKFKYKTKAV